jgi:hypothetical protein
MEMKEITKKMACIIQFTKTKIAKLLGQNLHRKFKSTWLVGARLEVNVKNLIAISTFIEGSLNVLKSVIKNRPSFS